MSKRKVKPAQAFVNQLFTPGIQERHQRLDVNLDNKIDPKADFVTVHLRYKGGTFSVNLKVPKF